jgi:hypothetical protein
MALTQDRDTRQKDGTFRDLPVAASTKIFAGALLALNASGYVVPGATAIGLKALGRAEKHVDNSTGAAGDASVTVRKGVFQYGNGAGADALAQADIGATAYIIDDATVGKDATGRSAAGVVYDVDTSGVWVQF